MSGRNRGARGRVPTGTASSAGRPQSAASATTLLPSAEKKKKKISTGKTDGADRRDAVDPSLVERLNHVEERVPTVMNELQRSGTIEEVAAQLLPTASATLEERIEKMEKQIYVLCNLVTSLAKDNLKTVKLKDDGAKRTKPKYRPLNTEEMKEKEVFSRFFTMKFTPTNKRSIDPYVLRDEIVIQTGKRPKTITTSGRENFNVEVCDREHGENIMKISSVRGVSCVVAPTTYLNRSKGLIYISEFNIDDIEQFMSELKQYLQVANVSEATFIKPKYAQTKVFLLEFEQEQPPQYVYIPGERSDTTVYPYKEKPLHCNKCQLYGHSASRCNRNLRCAKCGQEGHNVEACVASETSCFHCNGPHRVRDRNCPSQVKEEKVLEIQNKHKVGKRLARQILDGVPNTSQKANSNYPTHFLIKMNEDEKKKLSPWGIEKCIQHAIGSKPKIIRSAGRDSFVVEISEARDVEPLKNMNNVNGIPVVISEHPHFNHIQGLIFIYDYDLSNFESFRTGLVEEFNLKEAIQATWIKPRNPLAKPLLITFKQELPEFLNIPGEQSKTKVYEYIPRPMLCSKCLEYGHTIKHCSSEVEVCARCDTPGHNSTNCNADKRECHHCDAEHSTGYYKCKEFKYQKEIITLQKRHKLSRQQAINMYKTMYPSNDQDYSRVMTTPILGNRNDVSTNNIPSTSTATMQRGADHSPSINNRLKPQTPINEQQTHAKRRRGSKGETTAATSKKRITEVVCTDPKRPRIYRPRHECGIRRSAIP